jgi:hypothetical protein
MDPGPCQSRRRDLQASTRIKYPKMRKETSTGTIRNVEQSKEHIPLKPFALVHGTYAGQKKKRKKGRMGWAGPRCIQLIAWTRNGARIRMDMLTSHLF